MAIDPTIALNVRPASVDLNDSVRTAANLYELGNAPMRQKAESEIMDIEKRKAQLDLAQSEVDDQFRIISSATPQNYGQLRQMAINKYGEEAASRLPEQYDRGVIDNLGMSLMSTKDRLETQRAELLNNANIALKNAQVGTERAQQGNYATQSQANMALANQRQAAAGLNMANADNARIKGMQSLQPPSGSPSSANTQSPTLVPASKPLPIAAVNKINDLSEDLTIANNTQADLGAFVKQIDSGSLKFGPVRNQINNAQNYLGASTDESQNYQSFMSSLEKLRNDSLRLNKGVQTDGDAQRAWNELLTNVNDGALVKKRLQEIQKINERGAKLKERQINNVKLNYGQAPVNAESFKAQAAVGQQEDPLGIR